MWYDAESQSWVEGNSGSPEARKGGVPSKREPPGMPARPAFGGGTSFVGEGSSLGPAEGDSCREESEKAAGDILGSVQSR